MDLSDFIDKHKSETAWIFGKGPSLAKFDFKLAGPIRAAINDVAAHVPDCKYCFSNDSVKSWRDVYAQGQFLFQPLRALHQWDCRGGMVDCQVVGYTDDYDDEIMLRPKQELAKCLAIRRGTLGSAIQILHIMGIKTIHMVGIDGGNVHAPGYDWRTRLRNEHWKDYNAIRDAAIDAGDLLGITLKFHNQENTMTNDGKKYIKITRNCLAGGVHMSEGSIVALTEGVAAQLINTNSAIAWEKPEPKKVETATAPIEDKETAATNHKKGKRKS